jgi:hypothetical protein
VSHSTKLNRMKKYLPQISTLALTFALILVASGFLFPQTAHAQFGWIVDRSTDILLAPIGWIAVLILQIASLLTFLSGAILNYVVQYTVVDMAVNVSRAGVVNNAWGVIRDIANMSFIFILLYAAIQTILGIGSDTKKLIVNVIVVAILINFSLFFTRVVIDASNVLAVTFYDAISPGALSDDISRGISSSLMEPLKIQSLWNTKGLGLEGKTLIVVGVMGTIVSLIAAFIFFAVAIMFIIRFVVLIFTMILSPLAFMGFILPQLKKYKDQWWDALSGQAFFAPIYFLLTWIVIVIARGLLTSDGGTMAEVFVGTTGADGEIEPPNFSSIGILVDFIIMIALLIASLLISKEFANKAGSSVAGLTKWATGAAGSATLGIAGRFGRGTAGRLGQVVADMESLKNRPESRMARLALATGKKTAGASFDVRSTGLSGTLGAGKGQVGGFAADLKRKTEAEKKYAEETFKPSELSVMQAEKSLSEAKKAGTPADIATAQAELDRINGASEDALRQRKLKELRARGMGKKQAKTELDRLEDERLQEINRLTFGGWSQEEAEKDAESRNIGWTPKAVEGLLNKRRGAYAKSVETQKLGRIPVGLGRHLFIGPVKKEAKLSANAIRKSMKEKKPGEKIAEEIEKQAKESSDESGTNTTPAPQTESGTTPPRQETPPAPETPPATPTT